jgi:hypothetical protein
MNDFDFIEQSAQKAGTILNLTEWFDDLKFLQIFMLLHSSCGGDYINMQHWLKTANTHLQSKVPANLITTEQGIQDVLDYALYLTH